MIEPSRRVLLTTALAAAAGTGTGLLRPRPAAASLVVADRPLITHGVMSGDVTDRTAVVWARSDRPARLVARVRTGSRERVVSGPWATPGTDHTARIHLRGLEPGARHDVRLMFVTGHGNSGEPGHLSFTTGGSGAQSLVWTGDTCGQGWGINPDLGGMRGYRAMHRTEPDVFLHSGDTIYADAPISERVVEPDGQVWRNLVIPEVTRVAQELGDFRGRHRYNMLDENLRALYAQVPVVAQWDDHETVNNWYPGEVLDDPRYTRERRASVLAARSRRAWYEWQPVGPGAQGRPEGPRSRIYRRIPRGRHLEIFCLDMRTYRGPNTANQEPKGTPFLGREQLEWLLHGLRTSRATWKVIAADMPLGLVIPDGPVSQEAVANADPGAPLGRELEIARLLSQIRRHRVRGVIWLTADVHYAAAHHYHPSRAAFTDFDPFWELVAGPISAGPAAAPRALDATFGPRVVFQRHGQPGQSPRSGTAHFFGRLQVAADGALTASLRNVAGSVVWSRQLSPHEGS